MDSIILKGVSKKYTLAKERPILLKNLFVPPKKEEVWALKNISLTIKKGETIGIIGENGAGKSTLLKIIAGITTPTKGSVEVNGKVGSLIELGAGFHPDLTGKENVYLNGTLLGFTKKELDKKYKEIVEFADIGHYVDHPVRTYSSGMTVRLGFSVAVHLDPDILLIDEVLAVGDEEFQRKCIEKINQIKKNSKTIVLVSHNLTLVASLCKKSIWVDEHVVKNFDKTSEVIKKYLNSIDVKQAVVPKYMQKRWGSGQVKIRDVTLFDEENKKRTTFYFANKVLIKMRVKFYQKVENPVFGITLRNSNLEDILFTNTHLLGIKTGIFEKGEEKIIDFFLDNHMREGKYFISPAIASFDLTEFYDWRDNHCYFFIGEHRSSHQRVLISIY